jgi:hypothetical protein
VKLVCAHRIACSADAFWSMLHEDPYESRWAEAIGLRAYRELERHESPSEIYRRIQVEVALPDALLSLIRRAGASGPPSYVEEQWRSRSERVVRWRITPNTFADRARASGIVRVEPRGPASCERFLDGSIEVGVPVVGMLIERMAVAMVVDSYEKGAKLAGRI